MSNIFSFSGIIWIILQQGTVLSFMQASVSEEEEEEERTGCSRQRAWKGRRSFVIGGEAGHKQGSQLPGLLIQHPQIKPGTRETCDGCTGKVVHFSCISQPLAWSSQPHQGDQPFSPTFFHCLGLLCLLHQMHKLFLSACKGGSVKGGGY